MNNELLFSLMEDVQFSDIMSMDIIQESIFDKNSNEIKIIKEPVGKYDNYVTDLKYKDINIEISIPTNFKKEYINGYLNSLQNNQKVINEFDKIIDIELQDYLKYAQEDIPVSAKNVSELKKLCTVGSVIYYPDDTFEIYINNLQYNNQAFHGNHTFIIEIHVNNGHVTRHRHSVEG